MIQYAGRDFQEKEVVFLRNEPSYVTEDHVIPRKPEFGPYDGRINGDPERCQIDSTVEHPQPPILAPSTPEESRGSRFACRKSIRAMSANELLHRATVNSLDEWRLCIDGYRVAMAVGDSHGYSGDPSKRQDKAAEAVQVAMEHVEWAIARDNLEKPPSVRR
jgi:hypothetical protein